MCVVHGDDCYGGMIATGTIAREATNARGCGTAALEQSRRRRSTGLLHRCSPRNACGALAPLAQHA
jgi:hypothetical protein